MTAYGWKDDSAALFPCEGKLGAITIHPFPRESVHCGHGYWYCWCVDHTVSCKASEAPWPSPRLLGSGSLLPAPSTWLLEAPPHPRQACSPGQHRSAVIGVGAEDVVGLAGAVQKLPYRLAAELRQGPGLVLEEPLVRLEALVADELLALEAPVVGRLFAAGAKCLLACDLLVHRQPPLQALEEDVVQGLRAGAWGPGGPADRTLHAGLLQASWTQRVQTRQELGALSFCPAALAAQELELFLRGLLGIREGGETWSPRSPHPTGYPSCGCMLTVALPVSYQAVIGWHKNPGLSVSQSPTDLGLPTFTPLFTEHLLLMRQDSQMYSSSPQPFGDKVMASWKTVFLWVGWCRDDLNALRLLCTCFRFRCDNLVVQAMRAAVSIDEVLLSCWLLATVNPVPNRPGQVPVRGLELGDPWFQDKPLPSRDFKKGDSLNVGHKASHKMLTALWWFLKNLNIELP